MRQEIEQTVDGLLEQEPPSPDQLDVGAPFEFSGSILTGEESSVWDEAVDILAALAGKKWKLFQLSDFDSRYADDEIAIWIDDVGVDTPTGEDIAVQLEKMALNGERRQ